MGARPAAPFIATPPPPPLPPPPDGAGSAPPPPDGTAVPPPPPDGAKGPPPIDVPGPGDASHGSAGEPPPEQRAAELRERQRNAEQLAGLYCGWLKHAQQQLREAGAPITLADFVVDDMVYPAAVRVILRENVIDKMSSEDMDNALCVGPLAVTLWFKYQTWKANKATAPAAASRPRPADPPPPASPPGASQKPPEPPPDEGIRI